MNPRDWVDQHFRCGLSGNVNSTKFLQRVNLLPVISYGPRMPDRMFGDSTAVIGFTQSRTQAA